MFALDIHEIGLQAAVGDHLREVFHQGGLRCNRINCDDVRARQSDADGRRLVSFADDEARLIGGCMRYIGDGGHRPISSTMQIARCDEAVSIRQHGKKESLNVSVACGVTLFRLVYSGW